MAKALQRRRGTNEEHKSFTGLEGEFTYDTTEKRIVAHDGVTKGGIPMAKKAELDSANSDLATTKTELQKAIDDAVAELSGNIAELGKHNVGEEWVSYLGKIPEGGVPYCGQEVTRVTYADLWVYAQAQGLVKTEYEWQSIASAQNGNVPFYSDGDGSTTFRMPSIKGYVKGASSQSESGAYIKEGLPNITGTIDTFIGGQSGVFSDDKVNGSIGVQAGSASTLTHHTKGFIASRSSPIYGNSSHVTPETSMVLFGVYAFGEITNQGALDATTLATGLATVESRLGELEPLKNVDGSPVWGGKSVECVSSYGANYTRFESGLQICFGNAVFYASGTVVTLPVPFLHGDSYVVIPSAHYGSSSNLGSVDQHLSIGGKTSTGFVGGSYANAYCEWIAIGRWK